MSLPRPTHDPELIETRAGEHLPLDRLELYLREQLPAAKVP